VIILAPQDVDIQMKKAGPNDPASVL